MTYEEFKDKLIEITKNPDTMTAKLNDFMEEVKVDYDGMSTLKEQVEKSDARIRDLQDTNMKLFLAQTGKVEDEEPEELEGQMAVDDFIKGIIGNDVQ